MANENDTKSISPLVYIILHENTSKKEKYMELKKFLLESGVYPNLKGYTFLVDAVKLVKQNPSMSIIKDLYPTIAKLHSTTASKVERAMRHVVSTRIKLSNYQKIGIEAKPTNSEFIWFFAVVGGKENG